jgi:hypothetical protein
MSKPSYKFFGETAVLYKAAALAAWKQLDNIRVKRGLPTMSLRRIIGEARILITSSKYPSANRILINSGATTLHAFMDYRASFDWFWDYSGATTALKLAKQEPYALLGSTTDNFATFPNNKKPYPDIYAGKSVAAFWFQSNYTIEDFWGLSYSFQYDGEQVADGVLLYSDDAFFSGDPDFVTIFDVPRDGYTWADLSWLPGSGQFEILLAGSAVTGGLLRVFYLERYDAGRLYLLGFNPTTGVLVESQVLPSFVITDDGMTLSRMYQLRHESFGDVMYTKYDDSDTFLSIADVDNGVITGGKFNISGLVGTNSGHSTALCVTELFIYMLTKIGDDIDLHRTPRYDFWRASKAFKVGDVRHVQGTDGFYTLTCTTGGESGATVSVSVGDIGLGFSDGSVTWSVAVAALSWDSVYLTAETQVRQASIAVAVSPDDSTVYTGWQAGDFSFDDMYLARGLFSVFDIEAYTEPITELYSSETVFGTGQNSAGIIGLKYK